MNGLVTSFFKFPMWISWEVTFNCNYDCIHCRMDDGSKLPKELSYDKCIQFIDEIVSLDINQINFSGGEPFVRKDFLDIVEYASNAGLKIGITTNGSLINKSVISRLKSLENIECLQVSLDADNSELHDYIRGVPGAFDQAINAIKLFKEAGFRTGCVTTVMKKNITRIPYIIDLLNQYDVDVYGARRFMPTGKGKLKLEELVLSVEEYKNHCVNWIKYMNSKSKMQFIIEEPLLSILEKDLPEDWKLFGCVAGTLYGAMTADGDIRPCIFLPINIGNIQDKTFKEIWLNSKAIKEIVNRNKLTGKCNACDLKFKCGGCRAMAYFEGNEIFGDDPSCFYEKRMEGVN